LRRAKPCGNLLFIASRIRYLNENKDDKKDEVDNEGGNKDSLQNSGEEEK
jgi:hypothetical protein